MNLFFPLPVLPPVERPTEGGKVGKEEEAKRLGPDNLFLLQDNLLLLGAVYFFSRECPIQKFDFPGLNHKSLVSIEVS